MGGFAPGERVRGNAMGRRAEQGRPAGTRRFRLVTDRFTAGSVSSMVGGCRIGLVP